MENRLMEIDAIPILVPCRSCKRNLYLRPGQYDYDDQGKPIFLCEICKTRLPARDCD